MSLVNAHMRRAALALVGATAVWDGLEAAVALFLGIQASSVALTAFGLDSGIEIIAAGTLLWRLRLDFQGRSANEIARGEQRALRVVGWTFMALALYVVLRAGYVLWMGERPGESALGMILAVAALFVMSLLAWGKLRVAAALGSSALRAEAKESLACMYLSVALLVGLGAHAWFGWWWADPVTALAMVPWLLSEGREALEEAAEPLPER